VCAGRPGDGARCEPGILGGRPAICRSAIRYERQLDHQSAVTPGDPSLIGVELVGLLERTEQLGNLQQPRTVEQRGVRELGSGHGDRDRDDRLDQPDRDLGANPAAHRF
jgi:hypothetical protein